ncbi:MAG TPA: histidine kinase dimerization/phosphoacceptor domain -containing protein [Bryobacteraceae bacterium]|nr:histidine kinase dimerization/phosphoacceptor domain -containing protein [Bryobacteraceae bacterium]
MEIKRELLDPGAWAEVLELCASAMQVAVALIDEKGHLVGTCHNPQPIWTLARNAKPEWGAGCLFCLGTSAGACTADADARRTHSVVLAHDRAGFAHIALPLFLGERHFGTILAGQVLDGYPDPLALERVAKEYGLSTQPLWNLARHQIPVSRSNLKSYGRLLHTLGQALLGQRHATILKKTLATTDAELQSTNQELEKANSDLQDKVAELSTSNGEKTILLHEVHHRVNNNLQVIASLLRMQAQSSGDSQLTDALRTTQLRVEAMALIHAQLYDAADLQQVDFAEYTARLADNLLLSYGVDRERIAMSVDINTVRLTVNQAIPSGLILGELISNAIKYAFPEQRRGSIRIEGGRRGNRIELVVRDDGVGVAQRPEPKRSSSRGLQIVKILCGQLHATLEQTRGDSEPGPGTVFRISFEDGVFSRKV